MNTYTGKQFSVFHPEIERIDICDIAHALSLLCRGNGHVKHFYSVGQHCINCALLAKARGYSIPVQFACLLHDASEAYMSDVIRPIKKELPLYQEIEEHLLEVIFQRYGIAEYINHSQVKEIDDDLCNYDLKHLIGVKGIETKELEYEPDLTCYAPNVIEERYLALFQQLNASL
ncbi:MAG: phosphohydrolase [Erysipelotrichaceae bacterium]|nr:phosphohydrolase [Erysipelotrichaceae bacterium]